MKILITGTNGYIGKSLYNNLKDYYQVTPLTRKKVDLTNSLSVSSFFKDKFFDVVIHCAVSGGHRLQTDTSKVIDDNLLMYYNLLENKSHYGKFIHFGSGAEQHNTFYGLSKKVISESINGHHNFYNIRIYAVFDENELDSRYIKTNLKKYINKDKINIFQNKFMDFFYMGDLIKLVEYYLTNNDLPKEVDCTYNKTLNLFNIAEIINSLDSHDVKIHIVNPIFGKDYKGTYTSLNLNYVGLKQGIINTYNKLKNEY